MSTRIAKKITILIFVASMTMMTVGIVGCGSQAPELKGFKPAKSPEYFKEHKVPSYDKRRIEEVRNTTGSSEGGVMEFSTGDSPTRISTYYKEDLTDSGFKGIEEEEPFGWLLLKASKKAGGKTTQVDVSISGDSTPQVAVYATDRKLAEKPASFAIWGVPTYFKAKVKEYRMGAVDLNDPTSAESVLFIGSDTRDEILDYFMARLAENSFDNIQTVNVIDGSVSIEAEKEIGDETVMVHILVSHDKKPRVLIETWLDSWD